VSVTVTSTTITISGGIYSFEELYTEVNDPTAIYNSGKYFKILRNVVLTNNSKLVGSNSFIEVTGSLFQIHKGSCLQLGDYVNDIILNPCTINIPNVKLGYGFGCTTTTDSGDLLAYGATMNIPGFWGFFEGTNHIELIKCSINGFGRASGPNSKLYGCDLYAAHGVYGGFALYGTVAVYDKMNVFNSVQATSSAIGASRCAVYHNPKYSHDMLVTNAILTGYDQLAYIENTSGGSKLTLRDCDIRGSRTISRLGTNVTYYEQYTYGGVIRKLDGSTVSGASVSIKNSTGASVYNTVTDTNGNFSTALTTYVSSTTDVVTKYNPFTVTITSNTDTMVYTIEIDRPMRDVNVYFISGGSGGTVDTSTIQGMLDTLQANVIQAQSDNLANVSTELTSNMLLINGTVASIKDDNKKAVIS